MTQHFFGMINILFSLSSGSFEEGDDVNNLTLWENAEGAKTIGDFNGQWLVLYFYPKANTPGCTKEAISYNDLLTQFHETNAEIIGVSTDSERKHEQFRQKQNLNLRFISDPDGDLAKAFGIKIMLGMCARDTVLIDPDGRVDTIYKGVNPQANAENVLQYIQDKNLIRQTKNT